MQLMYATNVPVWKYLNYILIKNTVWFPNLGHFIYFVLKYVLKQNLSELKNGLACLLDNNRSILLTQGIIYSIFVFKDMTTVAETITLLYQINFLGNYMKAIKEIASNTSFCTKN